MIYGKYRYTHLWKLMARFYVVMHTKLISHVMLDGQRKATGRGGG